MAEWREVKTQFDANALMEVFGSFHDSCIREAHLSTGCWVATDLRMTCSTFLDHYIRFLVQRQLKDPSAIELLFEEVTRFNLVPAPENSDSIISEATILVEDGIVFWSVQDGWRPDSQSRDDATWVSAMVLRWRPVDWLGEELRYGPQGNG